MIFGDRLRKILIWMLVFIFLLDAAALYFFLFWRINWFDMFLHFLGGAWIGLFTVWFLYFSGGVRNFPKMPCFLIFLSVLSTAALAGVLWEFFEFLFDQFVGRGQVDLFQIGVRDTMSDLLFDLIGGVTIFLMFLNFLKKK